MNTKKILKALKKLCKTKQNPYLPIITTSVGVVVGALGTLIYQHKDKLINHMSNINQKKTVITEDKHSIDSLSLEEILLTTNELLLKEFAKDKNNIQREFIARVIRYKTKHGYTPFSVLLSPMLSENVNVFEIFSDEELGDLKSMLD